MMNFKRWTCLTCYEEFYNHDDAHSHTDEKKHYDYEELTFEILKVSFA